MPIKTDDPAALEKLDAKLNACIKLQETMKAVNAIVRSNRSNEEKRTLIMNKHHISAESIDDLLHPKQSWQKPGFPGYALTNNNAEIRRLKARIAAVSNYQKEVEKVEETGEMPEFTFAGGRIVDNVPENRIQIFFDSKPEQKSEPASNKMVSAGRLQIQPGRVFVHPIHLTGQNGNSR